MITPIAISIDETGAAIGLGRTKIYSLIAEGSLEVLKIGRRTLVTVESITGLIEKSRVTSSVEQG